MLFFSLLLLLLQEIPEEILKNITGQIRQVMPVPKRLDEFSAEERDQFPRLFEWRVLSYYLDSRFLGLS